MTVPTLSLCMIVKNEEKVLARCLESVRPFVNEIVVVDTGSEDATVEIARRYGAVVHRFDWVDDFSAARNFALAQSSGRWILVLDADEVLEDGTRLREDMQEDVDYLILQIKNKTNSDHFNINPAIRLFQNRPGLHYQGRIHEHLNVEELNLRAGIGQSLILHDGYQAAAMTAKSKKSRNMALLLQAVHENPSGYNLFNLGVQYKVEERYDDAIAAFKQAYPKSKEKTYLPSLLFHMIDTLIAARRYEEAIPLVQNTIDTIPDVPDFYFLQGRLMDAYGCRKDAVLAYTKGIGLPKSPFASSLDGAGGYLSYYNLAHLAIKEDRKYEALQHLTHSLGENKAFRPALQLYASLLRTSGVPHQQMCINLLQVHPVEQEEDLHRLLQALYMTRHSTLSYFLERYNVRVEPAVHAVGLQLEQRYVEARDLWLSVDRWNKENCIDLLVLSLLLQDEMLLEKAHSLFNLNKKEWQTLKHLVLGETDKDNHKGLTPDVERILLQMSLYTLNLQEEDAFEQVSLLIFRCATQIKTVLAIELEHSGHSEIALELLMRNWEQTSADREALMLVGDICFRQNNLQDALAVYMRLYEQEQTMRIYERIHDLYEKMGDTDGMRMVQRQTQAKYPFAQWTKQDLICK